MGTWTIVAPALRASLTISTVFSSMRVDSITGLTASCNFPPGLVKSFWYSIRTRAVVLGFIVIRGIIFGVRKIRLLIGRSFQQCGSQWQSQRSRQFRIADWHSAASDDADRRRSPFGVSRFGNPDADSSLLNSQF